MRYRKAMWAVIAIVDNRVLPRYDTNSAAIFFDKEDAEKERERRYTFRDQMNRESRVKRVLVG